MATPRANKCCLSVEVLAELKSRQVGFHDLDNLLKQIFDALQGRLGGPKGSGPRPQIIANDSQIFRVTMEKRLVSDAKPASVRIVIRPFDEG